MLFVFILHYLFFIFFFRIAFIFYLFYQLKVVEDPRGAIYYIVLYNTYYIITLYYIIILYY